MAATLLIGAASGAFLGAGLAGLQSDVGDQINGTTTNDKDWAINLGVSFAFGAVSGAAGAGIGLIPSVSIIEGVASVGVKEVGKLVLRTIAKLVLNTTVTSGLDALRQVTSNAIAGRPLDEGVEKAAMKGAVTGFITQGMPHKMYIQYAYSYRFSTGRDYGLRQAGFAG